MASSSEERLKQQLEELKKQLGKKQLFEEAVSSINSLLQKHFSSASPSLRESFYTVVRRVATILTTRSTAPGFWRTGLRLFEVAEGLFPEPSEKDHMKKCISQAKEHLHEANNPAPAPESAQNRGYLFEGHVTVDPEPPQPHWLEQANINTDGNASHVLEVLMSRLVPVIPEIPENESAAPRVPPASKEVVAKLPVITLTEEVLAKVGPDAECSICKVNWVLGDQMQELPCKHTLFHPPCLKQWLDEHNSCPICRHELQTDDHAYESWKKREREAEEERRGAANAVRGGEYMYV